MIERVRIDACFGPDAEAEVGGGRRAGRVQDFGVIRVPLTETRIHDCVIRDRGHFRTFGNKDNMPETDDGGVVFSLAVLRCDRGIFDRGAQWD